MAPLWKLTSEWRFYPEQGRRCKFRLSLRSGRNLRQPQNKTLLSAIICPLLILVGFDVAVIAMRKERKVGFVPGRGLEPLRITPPDPKSGASANSATLAERRIDVAQISPQSLNLEWADPSCVAACQTYTRRDA